MSSDRFAAGERAKRVNYQRAAGAAMPKIVLANHLYSEANDIAPFLSLRSALNVMVQLLDPNSSNVYRIDKLANRMGFNRQLESARIVAAPAEVNNSNRKQTRPSDELITAITAMDENIEMLGVINGELNNNNVGTTSTAEICARAVAQHAKDDGDEQENIRAYSRVQLDNTGVLEGLNASQRLAVYGAATNRLTLVQGPPGTGKTAVAIRILSHWAKISNGPVLATSDSNIAVDNLGERAKRTIMKPRKRG